MKKKKLLVLISGLSSILMALTIVLGSGSYSFPASGEKDQFGITFNSSTNKFFSGTGAADHSGEATIKTNSGNDIDFSYSTLAGGSTSVWHLVKNGGYFYNTTPIHGIKTLSISCTASDKTFRISWGRDLTFDLGNNEYLSSVDKVTCNFGNDNPTYFKFENISGSNLNIKDLSIALDCVNYYPVVTINPNFTEMGTVSGGGTKNVGDSVTIVATPNPGYRFIGWYENDTLISSNDIYTFEVGYADFSYIAKFTYESYNLVVESSSLTKGYVSDCSGSYNYLSQVTIEAHPYEGYSFGGWYDGSSVVSMDNPYSFSMPNNNLAYTAIFTTNSYLLTLTNLNSSLGIVSGSGEYLYGSSVMINASANDEVAFLGWFDGDDNLVSDLKSYSFNMPHNDLELFAKFDWVPYSVSLTINDESMGSVLGGGSYHYGQSVTLKAFPKEHHSFFGWFDGEVLLSKDSSFTFDMPNDSLNYEARFVRNYSLIVYSDDEDTGTVSSPAEFGAGLEVTVSAYPKAGYAFDCWCDENYDDVSYDETYTFIMPEHDLELIAVFTSGKNVLTLVSNFPTGAVNFNGQGYHTINRTVSISSNAINGLIFDGWYDDNFNLISASNSYSFKFTQNTTLIAYYHYASISFTFDNFDDSLNTCTLTGASGIIVGELYVPRLYNGYSVSTIGEKAFYRCVSLISVFIGDDVTSLSKYAFRECISLTSINLGNGVISIGDHVFWNCYFLKSVVFSNCLTSIGTSAFNGCSSLASIVIPDSVEIIGSYAFSGCTSLTNVELGNNVVTIGKEAFYNCYSLISITIPTKVTSIGDQAFYKCSKLLEVINESSLEFILGDTSNGHVAYYAKHIITSKNDSNLHTSSDGLIICDDGDNVYLTGYVGTGGSVVVPDGVTSICMYAFHDCSTITSITLPDSVTVIDKYAFFQCTNLTSVTLGANVDLIDDYAFYKCSSLNSINLGDTRVTKIEAKAFCGCQSLSSIILPSTLTYINYESFDDCDKIVEVINKSSLNIGGAGADNVKQVIKNEGDSKVYTDSNGFVTYVDGDEVYLVNYIGHERFISIPEGVTTIGANAFYSNDLLNTLVIPDSVSTIENHAFYYCFHLAEVINNSSLNLVLGDASNGFVAYYAKQIITDKSDSKIHYDSNGFVTYIDGDEVILINYIGTESSITIPSEVTSIANYAFYYNDFLVSVNLGHTINSIGSNAFTFCTSLLSIIIPSSVSIIGSLAFSICSRLTILCEVATAPDGWSKSWNSNGCPVFWEYVCTY